MAQRVRTHLNVEDWVPRGSLWRFDRPFPYDPRGGRDPIVFLDAFLESTEDKNVRFIDAERKSYYVVVKYLALGEEIPQEFRYCEVIRPGDAEGTFICNWTTEWYRMDGL